MKTKITFLLALFCYVFLFYSQAAELTATSSTISTVYLGAGDGDVILLDAGSYNYGFPIQASKTITIKKNPAAATTPIITAQLVDPAGDNGGLIFDGVKFVRGVVMSGSDYVINYSSGMQRPISTLQFKNCEMTGFGRSFIRMQGAALATATIGSILIDNCLIHDIGNSYTFIQTNHILGALTVTNSTLYNYGGDKFFAPNNSTQAAFTLNFTNNTVYKWSKSGQNFFDVSNKFTNASVYNIKDNIFNLIYSGTKGTNYILNCTNGGTLNAANNLSVDFYGYNMTGTGATINNTDLALNTGVLAGVTSIPFEDASTYNFSILSSSALATASSTNGIIGDPGWLKVVTAPVSFSASVSPTSSGTVSPATATYNAGDQVTVTATKGFGYVFKEWQDANNSNALVSTANPYTFAMNANTSLVAVFDPVTTYDFTLTKAGSTWGNVTVSPAATNGKYETGTVVTMTIVPNPVTSFVNWEDNSTATPRTITMDGNKSFTANFTETPFIAGWDFKIGSPTTARVGDFYSNASNKGVLNIYEQTGTATSWLAHSGWSTPTTPCAILWTGSADFATNRRYWQATFSTSGYTGIQVKSLMSGSYQYYTNQKMKISLNGTDFSDLANVNLTTSWSELNASLPAIYEGQSTVYIRWVGDATSTLVGTGNDGTAITNIFVFGTPIGTGLNNNALLNAYANSNTNGQIIINSSLKNGKATIYSLMGQKLEEMSLTNASMLSKKLNSGIYLVKFEEAGVVSTQKVIVD